MYLCFLSFDLTQIIIMLARIRVHLLLFWKITIYWTIYSGMPKSELVRISEVWLSFGLKQLILNPKSKQICPKSEQNFLNIIFLIYIKWPRLAKKWTERPKHPKSECLQTKQMIVWILALFGFRSFRFRHSTYIVLIWIPCRPQKVQNKEVGILFP